ncbi:MAG TPA: stage III sporulation protein AF [Firmicutes bacterium]|nr:stage III sporulation protein AF [Bacillota bacterium]
MFEWVTAYSKTVVSFLLLEAFAELILPEGYEKQLRLFGAMALILVVAAPLLNLQGQGKGWMEEAMEQIKTQPWAQEAWLETEVEQTPPLWQDIYRKRLQEELCTATGAKEVVVELKDDGQIDTVRLTLPQDGPSQAETLARTAQYGLTQEQVQLDYE